MSDQRHVVHVPAGSPDATCDCGWSAIDVGEVAADLGRQHIVASGFHVVESPKMTGDLQLLQGRAH